jgi:hypothetical protein
VPRPHHLSSPGAFAVAVRHESVLRVQRARMERGLARAGRSGADVVVGPWLSELGFEILYWIPLLRRLCERHGVTCRQVTAISRGGTSDWYAGVADGYVDVHDILALDEFRSVQERRIASDGGQKQLRVTAMDRRLWRAAATRGAVVVHPLVMYSRLRYYWAGEEGLDAVQRRCSWRPFATPPPPDRWLPERFVAAKPYFSDCFPDTPANRTVVRRVLTTLARDQDVVLLSTGLAIDDHDELDVLDHPRIHVLDRLAPRDNLEVQTRVLARARAFVGTYGGPSYLATCLGIPSVGLAAVSNHNPRHLAAARRAAEAMGVRTPVLIDATARDAVQQTLHALSG